MIVIPNAPAESGRVRDLTMRVGNRGRKRDLCVRLNVA
jgi:hypothetical protein